MKTNIYQEIHDKFPPSSQNNGRAIVKSIIDRAVERPSMSKFQEIEADWGFPSDFDSDYGTEKQVIN